MTTFDIEVERNVVISSLSWPEPCEAGHDGGLGCNRAYMDLRQMPWREAHRVSQLESQLIKRLHASGDPEDELDRIENEFCEEFNDHIYGLDIGVASTVIALSAARCLPFTSCNAGTFGGYHTECYPFVAFFSKPQAVPLLTLCAQDAGTGLENALNGSLVVYANDIAGMRLFAKNVMARSVEFRTLKFPRANKTRIFELEKESLQLKLL